MKAIEKTGKTVEEAIATALAELHLNKEDVTIEVLTKGSRGILGFGAKDAKIRVSYDQEKIYEYDLTSKEKIESNRLAIEKAKNEEFINNSIIEPAKIATKDTIKELSNADLLTKDTILESIDTEEEISINNVDDVVQKAIQFLQKFLQEIQLEGDIKVIKKSASFIGICLEGKNMGILIGRKGETLDAIQYLVNIIANKGRQHYVKILVDTENYRAKREQALKELVAEMSVRVKKSQKPVMLEPMNPYDRRIVHAALQEDPLVKTYSEGKDPFRKVIIIPNDLQLL